MNLWDNPCGKLFKINSKSDLATLINKLGFNSKNKLASFGITVIGECSYHAVDSKILPIFNKNKYLEHDEQLSKNLKADNAIIVSEKNIELHSKYNFPCAIYIHFEESKGRAGALKIESWIVESFETMMTVDDVLDIENANQHQWNTNLESAIKGMRESIDCPMFVK